MVKKSISTKQKALQINLNRQIYGSFAEIGAGQEVARYFFVAGGASGTVAQTISAYDMVFSDSLYGKETSGRYVCESRVRKMIDHEYSLLNDRLAQTRGKDTCFFAFANTVATSSYDKHNEGHGWVGCRFQLTPNSSPNDVVLHIRMAESSAQEQQKSLGVIGVNLIHACFNYHHSREDFIASLMDHLSSKKIEIDMIKFTGPNYGEVDNRLMSLELVRRGYTNAVMFNENGETVLPQEVLYKKNILAVRGSYRPPTWVNLDMIEKGRKHFLNDTKEKPEDTLTIAEMTINVFVKDGQYDFEDFLARVDMICALNYQVMVTNYPEYFRLSSYFSRFTKKSIGIVLGVYNFKQIFEDEYLKTLEGGVLESLGLLFRNNVKVYVYPFKDEKDNSLFTTQNIDVSKKTRHLYDYLKDSAQINDIDDYDPKLLHIYSRKVLNMILNNEANWEAMVPASVAKTIKDKCLFGIQCKK